MITSNEGDGDMQPLWLSDGPATNELWSQLRVEHTTSGLWPLLLDALRDRELQPRQLGQCFLRDHVHLVQSHAMGPGHERGMPLDRPESGGAPRNRTSNAVHLEQALLHQPTAPVQVPQRSGARTAARRRACLAAGHDRIDHPQDQPEPGGGTPSCSPEHRPKDHAGHDREHGRPVEEAEGCVVHRTPRTGAGRQVGGQ
ncbi:hypothetical protein CP970_43800 [Streptomyces kanamyceticus]|uniref:Uncharacterized protein n=1 Tax=Streptomyces kanamyceticus TaxID=1967 RepID=A0A5J6GLZ2_STRKN|nr:hypothetical protein CP970_43800 [Streptomyces kanamyceticus]